MLGALTCDPTLTFSGLCDWLNGFDHSGVIGPVVQRVLGPVLVFAVIIAVGRLLRRFLERAIDRAGGDQQVRILVHNLVIAFTWILAVIGALIEAGFQPAFLLTFGGASTLAVGLAFQDLLRNVLAGMFILIERPFKIEDLVSIGDVQGTVQTIKLRTTALRTGDGQLAIVPNLTAFSSVVINASAFGTRQYSIRVHLPDDADLETALTKMREELSGTKALAKRPQPSLKPQMAADGARSIAVAYWLDYRANSADAVMADLTGRLWKAAATPRPG